MYYGRLAIIFLDQGTIGSINWVETGRPWF